jgi:two-component system KDP operon response regulator KdpE
MSKPLLIVEDDSAIATLLVRYCENNGDKAIVAGDKASAIRLLRTNAPEAIILDLGLPDGDGKTLIQTIRKNLQIPIIILSARQNEEEIISCLDLGADDYITKPFSIKELFARIRSAKRRVGGVEESLHVKKVGPFFLDTKQHLFSLDELHIKLTPTEFNLLNFFMSHPNQVLTHKRILKDVWGVGYQTQTQYLRTYINTLRKKIEVDTTRPRYIQTESSIGYRFCIPQEKI